MRQEYRLKPPPFAGEKMFRWTANTFRGAALRDPVTIFALQKVPGSMPGRKITKEKAPPVGETVSLVVATGIEPVTSSL